jgi:hypothetical protein
MLKLFVWRSKKEAARKAAKVAAAEAWNQAHQRYLERYVRGDTRGQNATLPPLQEAMNARLRIGA